MSDYILEFSYKLCLSFIDKNLCRNKNKAVSLEIVTKYWIVVKNLVLINNKTFNLELISLNMEVNLKKCFLYYYI